MAKEGGLSDFVRRALGRPDGTPAPVPGPSGSRPVPTPVPASELPPGRRPTPQPAPPLPREPREVSREVREVGEVRPDPLTEGHWERRVFELERTLLEKNRTLLKLEEEIQRRDERLKEAFARLRDAEETVEIQHKLALLPTDSTGAPRPASSDALARLASEKGELLTRERKLRSEIEALRAQLGAAERTLRARDASLAEAQALGEGHEKELGEARERLRAFDARKDDRERALASERDQAVLDARRLEDRLRSESTQRAKAEQALLAAEQQAALYRKNLLGAEESQRRRGDELEASATARDRLEAETRDLQAKLLEAGAGLRRGEDERKALETVAARLRDELMASRQACDALQRADAERTAEVTRLEARLAEAETRERRRAAEAEAKEQETRVLGRDLRAARDSAVTVDRRRAAAEQALAAERETATREVQTLKAALERMTAARDVAAAEAEVLESAWLESRRMAARAELETATRLDDALAASRALAPPLDAPADGESLLDPALAAGASSETGSPLGALRRLFRRS